MPESWVKLRRVDCGALNETPPQSYTECHLPYAITVLPSTRHKWRSVGWVPWGSGSTSSRSNYCVYYVVNSCLLYQAMFMRCVKLMKVMENLANQGGNQGASQGRSSPAISFDLALLVYRRHWSPSAALYIGTRHACILCVTVQHK